ncbi:MAG: argininosuccinate lyase [Deltaproteobacteria bacterium]|nr:argininosuccinate lyase [Deltaproteobacteria bacterium]
MAFTRLWDKGGALNEVMHELTVGNDPVLDRELVCADAVGSAAHARMLASCGLLGESELRSLLGALKEIFESGRAGTFEIPAALEDVHTAIEGSLTESLGEPGRRIHTARSRNDQIVLATRLHLRRQVALVLDALLGIAEALSARFKDSGSIDMPGYTHMQPAMPSSVGMWLHSVQEVVLELVDEGLHLTSIIDRQPLGSGAGFGTSLPIDREKTAKLLEFSEVQRSFIDVNNSRGRYELKFLRWCVDIASAFEKLACDVMLFATREFGFISLPNDLTTGSSIMPQKRNPDVVELLRGRAARVRGACDELAWVTAKLTSSYHRDLQYTKEPFLRGAAETAAVLRMARLIIEGLRFDRDRLSRSMHPELYATYEANRLVAKGVPFRDAYRETAKLVESGKLDVASLKKDFELARKETESGMALATARLEGLSPKVAEYVAKLDRVDEQVFKID